jgi:hypothetical protein
MVPSDISDASGPGKPAPGARSVAEGAEDGEAVLGIVDQIDGLFKADIGGMPCSRA